MPVETPDDLASFFDEEGFGVSVRIDGQGPFSAIHEQGSANAQWGDGAVVESTDRFLFPALPGVPVERGTILQIVGTGARFEAFGEPLCEDGIWTCTGSPIA